MVAASPRTGRYISERRRVASLARRRTRPNTTAMWRSRPADVATAGLAFSPSSRRGHRVPSERLNSACLGVGSGCTPDVRSRPAEEAAAMHSKPSALSTGHLDDATVDRYVTAIWCGLHEKDGSQMLTPR